MDSTLYDSVTVASDSSLPQTPSPRSSIGIDAHFENVHNSNNKSDYEPIEPNSIFHDPYTPFSNNPDSDPITHPVESTPAHIWSAQAAAHHHQHQQGAGTPGPYFTTPSRHGSTGSLLQELHSQDYSDLDAYSPPPLTTSSDWSTPAPLPHPSLPSHIDHAQAQMQRRYSFPSPSMRPIRDDGLSHHQQQHVMLSSFASGDDTRYTYPDSSSSFYSEPLPMGGSSDSGSPQPGLDAPGLASAVHSHHHHHQQHHHAHPMHHHAHLGTPPHLEEAYGCTPSPHLGYRDMQEDGIKIEDTQAQQVIVPSQHIFYPRPSSQVGIGLGGPTCGTPQLPMPLYMAPHAAIPIQHTDEAASKETQYLRRRCFNCHTTEPPSWRRSTLNPGKIVCNKCGLYERTHLRPRPQRFDELRAGNKTRKHGSGNGGTGKGNANGGSSSPGSPNDPSSSPKDLVKKEQGEFELIETTPSRRASVSNSSVHSASSDLDDNVSIYSSSGSISGLDSYNNSPAMPSFMIPPVGSSPSSSPHISTLEIGMGVGGIRLPNAPLNDVAQLSPPLPQLQNVVVGMESMMSSPPTISALPPHPRKSATDSFFLANRSGSPNVYGVGAVGMVRRGSAPVEPSHRGSPMVNVPIALPEVGSAGAGWQGMGMGMEDAMMVRSRSSSRSSVAA